MTIRIGFYKNKFSKLPELNNFFLENRWVSDILLTLSWLLNISLYWFLCFSLHLWMVGDDIASTTYGFLMFIDLVLDYQASTVMLHNYFHCHLSYYQSIVQSQNGLKVDVLQFIEHEELALWRLQWRNHCRRFLVKLVIWCYSSEALKTSRKKAVQSHFGRSRQLHLPGQEVNMRHNFRLKIARRKVAELPGGKKTTTRPASEAIAWKR